MIRWMELRRGRLLIAGAGWAALGLSALVAGGCSTTTVADKSGAKSNQVAGRTKASATKAEKAKSAKEIAKRAPGKARMSDLDDEGRSRMVAQIAARNAPPRTNPAAATPTSPTVPAAAVAQQTAPRRAVREGAAPPVITPGSAGSAPNVAAAQRRAAAPATSQRREYVVAADARGGSGAIAQASGAGRSAASSRRATKSAGQAPTINPKKTQWQSENGGSEPTMASSHDRARANILMQRAHLMLENGYREEALRLASIAADLETSQQAIYRRGEERPTEFVAKLKKSEPGQGPSSAAAVADASGGIQAPAISARRSLLDGGRKNASRSAESSRSLIASTDPAGPEGAPRFTTDDRENLRAAANDGRLQVPVPPTPRNADATNNVELEAAALRSGSSSGVVTADRIEDAQESASPKKLLTSTAHKPAPVVEEDAPAPEAETDPLADTEVSTAAETPTSQLTIASIVGLLTGIAGMFGLGWWRRQEQRHYAAARKAPDLRIKETEDESAPVRRAA